MSGLPSSKQLKHPSSYGRLTLKEILDNKDNIKVEGVYRLSYKFVYYVYMSLYSKKLSTSYNQPASNSRLSYRLDVRINLLLW